VRNCKEKRREGIQGSKLEIMSSVVIPKDLKRLRCCLRCHLIKNIDQFVTGGCENCPELSGMKGSHEKVSETTTDKYYGFISLLETDTNKSWVARYLAGMDPVQGGKKRVPGVYAMKVFEEMESDVEAEIEAAQEAMAETELSEPDEDYQQNEGDEGDDDDGSATSEESGDASASSEGSSGETLGSEEEETSNSEDVMNSGSEE
jgi:transcription elongation factor SPT4